MNMKKHLIIYGVFAVVAIIVIVTLVYIIKTLNDKGNKGKVPAETDWGKDLTEHESATAMRLAKAMYDDMKGLNIWWRNLAVFNEYLGSSDRIFVATANYFYDTYGKGENLAQWLDNESFSFTDGSSAGETKNAIISRLANFGINV